MASLQREARVAHSHRAVARNRRVGHLGTDRSGEVTISVPLPAAAHIALLPSPGGTRASLPAATELASPLLSELIRTWPLPAPGWGRGYPPELVQGLLGEISDRVRRLEAGVSELKAELGLLQQTLAQRDWELDQHRYAGRGRADPADPVTAARTARTIDAAMAQAIEILDAAQRAAAGEMIRAARSAKAAQLYAHVITMKALRRAQRTPQAQHVAALQTELAYRTAQLTAVKEHVEAAAAAASFGSDPDAGDDRAAAAR